MQVIQKADAVIAQREKALKQNPNSVEHLCGLADGYTMKAMGFSWYGSASVDQPPLIEKAIVYAGNARKVDPSSPLPLISMAQALGVAERYGEAVQLLELAIKLDSEAKTSAGALLRALSSKVTPEVPSSSQEKSEPREEPLAPALDEPDDLSPYDEVPRH